MSPQQALDPRQNRALASAPPTNELGAVVQSGYTVGGMSLGSWSTFAMDELEYVPELQFPQSVRTYATMRNDAQVEGLYAGATMPIRRYKWMIDGNGCKRDRVERLAADLNLPIKGDPPSAQRPRSKKRFVFQTHLRDALLSIIYGFYAFEQVGAVGDDGYWHLRKLAPRPPITIQDIMLADDGGLLYIRQNIANNFGTLGRMPEIPVDRLVWYAWDQEGANWMGRSMLRAIYRNWLIKDRLMRVDAIKHERNGMGVPIAEGAPGMTDAELKQLAKLAQSFKAGEAAGGAIPNGTRLTLEGTRGNLPDTIASINFHNEEMARRFLMMFIQLGQTMHGSRALGKDFVGYFQLAQETIANWFKEVFNEHVIEDYWDWNYGETEDHTPFVVYERDDDPRFAAADLALMIQNNVIRVDDELEKAIREAMDLPEADESTIRVVAPANSPPGDTLGQPSTQPGNSNPDTPGSEQNPDATPAEKVAATKRREQGGGATDQLSSPAMSYEPHPLLRRKVVSD